MCVYLTDTVCVCMQKPDSDQMYMYVLISVVCTFFLQYNVFQYAGIQWSLCQSVHTNSNMYICMNPLLHDQTSAYVYVGTRRCYICMNLLLQYNVFQYAGACVKVCIRIRMYVPVTTRPMLDCTGPRLSRTMVSTYSGMSRSSSSPFSLTWPFCALW